MTGKAFTDKPYRLWAFHKVRACYFWESYLTIEEAMDYALNGLKNRWDAYYYHVWDARTHDKNRPPVVLVDATP